MLRTIAHSCAKSDLRIDLSAVTSIDAAGLGLLVELQTWADMNSRTLTLLDLSENVWRMVILTKLCAALEISYSDLIARDPEVDRRHHRQLIA